MKKGCSVSVFIALRYADLIELSLSLFLPFFIFLLPSFWLDNHTAPSERTFFSIRMKSGIRSNFGSTFSFPETEQFTEWIFNVILLLECGKFNNKLKFFSVHFFFQKKKKQPDRQKKNIFKSRVTISLEFSTIIMNLGIKSVWKEYFDVRQTCC